MKDQSLTALIDKAKLANKTPLQTVVPVSDTLQKEPKIEEAQVSFYLPKSIYKKVKLKSLEQDCSIKQILCNAITEFVSKA